MGFFVATTNMLLNMSKLGIEKGDTIKVICVGGGGGGGGGSNNGNSSWDKTTYEGGNAGNPSRGGQQYNNSSYAMFTNGAGGGSGYGAGGGGGVAGNAGLTGYSNVGGGGLRGDILIREFKVDELEVPITIGQGGTGGSRRTNGNNGGSTSFGSYITAEGGLGGLGAGRFSEGMAIRNNAVDDVGYKFKAGANYYNTYVYGIDGLVLHPNVSGYSSAVASQGTTDDNNTFKDNNITGNSVSGIGHGVVVLIW